MRILDLVLIVAVIALAVGFFGGPPEQPKAVDQVAASPPVQTPPQQQAKSAWSVHGVILTDSVESLTARFGEPLRDETDDTSRFTLFSTPAGELRRVEFFDTRVVNLSGDELEREGRLEVKNGNSPAQVKRALGEPVRIGQGDDHLTWVYDGATVYLRDGAVFGVVINAEVADKI